LCHSSIPLIESQTTIDVFLIVQGMSGLVRSIELWAASKIIGRECATVNKNYAICKYVCVSLSALLCLCCAIDVDGICVTE
jgi:hypothetical protein